MSLPKETIVGTRLTVSLHEWKNPLVIFCFGLLIGVTFYFQNIKQTILILLCLILLIVFLFFRSKKIILFTAAIVFSYFYTVNYCGFTKPDLDQFLHERYIYTGEITSKPIDYNHCKKYELNLTGLTHTSYPLNRHVSFKQLVLNMLTLCKSCCKVEVTGSKYEEYEPGDIVQVTGILKHPKSAILPGLFDERKYLLTKNIHYLLKADNGSLVFLDEAKNSKTTKAINRLRNKLFSINKTYLNGEKLSLVNGIIFGSKASALSNKLKEKIQNLGLSHITSASGFNVSILALGIFALFRFFNYKRRIFPTIVCICAVSLYSAIADFSPSIIRATVFIILLLIGNLFDKKIKILPGISIIIIGFFLYNPANLLDAGLQLSILGFLGLVLFTSEAIGENKNWFLNTFYQSLFAQIMVTPLIAFYFHNIQLLGLISNLVAVPLASLILMASIINIIFFRIPGVSHISQKILFYLSDLFIRWVNYLDKLEFKQVFLPSLNFYLLILTYAIVLFLLFTFFLRVPKIKIFIVTVILITAFAITYFITDTSKYLKIFFLPIYNQDAILIMPPKERPIYLSTKPQDFNHLKTFLMLNNCQSNTISYNLKNSSTTYFPSKYIKDEKNKIKVRYKTLSLDIIKNYKDKILPEAEYIKLPILNKKDPPLNKTFTSLPNTIIINDFKRLSKKSKEDLLWLKSKQVTSYFLSKTGTITLVSDGKKIYLTTSED